MITTNKKETPLQSLEWQFKEQEQHERGGLWYFIMIFVGSAILVYSVLTDNFLFALIAIMAGITLVINHRHKPKNINFIITYRGIKLNNKEYLYKELKNFWIIYEPPEIKTLYFTFKNSLQPRLPIPLLDQNPVNVKNMLNLYMMEDTKQEDEPFSDAVSRLFKL